MATVHIAIGYSKANDARGFRIPLRQSLVSRSVVMTSSGTSAQSSLTATQAEINQWGLWIVTVSGGAIDVTCGENPTAVNTNSHRVLDGQVLELGISAVGEKIAIKDA